MLSYLYTIYRKLLGIVQDASFRLLEDRPEPLAGVANDDDWEDVADPPDEGSPGLKLSAWKQVPMPSVLSPKAQYMCAARGSLHRCRV